MNEELWGGVKYARLCARVDFGAYEQIVFWETTERYGEYFVTETSDSFLIGILHWCMANGYDISCDAPVSEDILYQLNETFLPSIAKNVLHFPKIRAQVTAKFPDSANAIGGGMSCGIDSLYMAARHHRSRYDSYNLTHLLISNVGAFINSTQFEWQRRAAENVASEMGLPLIAIESNFSQLFPESHIVSHTYRNLAVAHALGKLFGVFYYSSSGEDLTSFSVISDEKSDCAHYDLLTCSCLSTRKLRLYSDGASVRRFEKTRSICSTSLAQNHLHVCVADSGENCGLCMKCRRTLLTLDALDALDSFGKVFDIAEYRRHRTGHLAYLYAQHLLGEKGDRQLNEAFLKLKKDINLYIRLKGFVLAIRGLLSRNTFMKRAHLLVRNFLSSLFSKDGMTNK